MVPSFVSGYPSCVGIVEHDGVRVSSGACFYFQFACLSVACKLCML
jgi:hypothetical protein